MRRFIPWAAVCLMMLAFPAWAQPAPGGLPQPVVNGGCIIGVSGQWVGGACSGSGTAVSSVANSDGTLTISPTTGSVVASIALGHANTWTGAQTFVAPLLGTPASGVLTNTTGLPVSTGISGLGTGIATFLATPSSANLAAAVTNETGSGLLVFGTGPSIVGGALSGTFSGTPTYSGVPVYTGLSAGTVVSGGWIGLDSGNNLVLGTPAGGGGSLTVTDGTHSVASTTTITVGNGFLVGGSAGSATLNVTTPDRTATTGDSISAADMTGQVNYNGSSITSTIPAISSTVFASGMSSIITNRHSTALTLSSTPTINGLASATTLFQYGWAACLSNGTSLDCFGFPGFGALSGGATATGAGVVTLGNPGASTKGGVQSKDCSAGGQFIQIINTDGTETCGTPAGGGNVSAAGTLTSGQIVIGQGTQAVAVDASAALSAGALTLGASGTAGSVAMGNATSGTITLQPVTGALGSVTASLPANTGTIAELNLAQSWTATQTHTSAAPQVVLGVNTTTLGSVKMFGNTSGDLTINPSAVAGTSSVATFPANTGTVAELNLNQAWTAGQAVTPDTATQCGTQSAAGTMTPNFALSNSCVATFGAGNLTIANPSNVKAGQSWVLSLTQDGTGSRTVTWGSQYKWAGGTAPTLSTAASSKDVISCFSDTTTTHNCTLAVKGAS